MRARASAAMSICLNSPVLVAMHRSIAYVRKQGKQSMIVGEFTGASELPCHSLYKCQRTTRRAAGMRQFDRHEHEICAARWQLIEIGQTFDVPHSPGQSSLLRRYAFVGCTDTRRVDAQAAHAFLKQILDKFHR